MTEFRTAQIYHHDPFVHWNGNESRWIAESVFNSIIHQVYINVWSGVGKRLTGRWDFVQAAIARLVQEGWR